MMHRVERPTMKRAALPLYAVALSLLAVMLLPAAARAQWTTTGSNISNSNSGNVGVGTGSNAPASRLEVFNPTGGSSTVNYFQVTGATADNSNYPGVQLKGGTLATEFPQFRLGNGGLGLNLFGGRSSTYGNRMGLWLSSNSSSSAYASVQKFDGTTTTDLFVVRDSGSVGIGTPAPGYRLHIAGDNTAAGGYPVIKMENTQAGGHAWWLYAGAQGTADAFGIYDETAAKYRLFFNSSGNLGVGTTSPSQALEVAGNALLNGPASAYFIANRPNNASYDAGLIFRTNGADKWVAGMLVGSTGGTNSADNFAVTYNNGSAWLNRFSIDTAGNVGVGTSAPAYRLDVQQGGQVNASGGLCIAGDCKTAWSQVGASQWTNAGSSVYYSAGNVGVGTASPQQRLDVNYGSTNTLKGIAVSETNSAGTTGLTVNNSSTSGSSGILLNVGDGNKAFIKVDAAKNLTLTTENATDTGLNAGLVMNAAGNVGVGGPPDAQGQYRLYVNGSINATYQDVAEWVPSSQKLRAGTVVVLDTTQTNHVLASMKAYDTGVAGVVSDNPGVILGQGGADKVKVATTGRVKVRVDATRTPIHVGDLLVTSDVEGVAMKSVPVDLGGIPIHRPGTIIGKALEPLEKGTGEILVLLSLQ